MTIISLYNCSSQKLVVAWFFAMKSNKKAAAPNVVTVQQGDTEVKRTNAKKQKPFGYEGPFEYNDGNAFTKHTREITIHTPGWQHLWSHGRLHRDRRTDTALEKTDT